MVSQAEDAAPNNSNEEWPNRDFRSRFRVNGHSLLRLKKVPKMVALPSSPTIDAIYDLYAKRSAEEPARDYLGGSEIGRECNRRIWYSFRHIARESFDGRMARLFQTGHREEARIIQDLKDIGCEVLDKDPATGKQWRYTNGHISGGLDAVVLGLPESPKTWHLLEVKSSNKKRFDELEKQGVQKAKPEHYAQMQIYMGMADLTRAVYIVWCKDDDRLFVERIEFDAHAYKALIIKAKRIINEESPPERISEKPDGYPCKFCPMVQSCHGTKMPAVSCRTCVHSSPVEGGRWECSRGLKMDPGCGEHIFIPGLLHWAEPVDGQPTWIKYRIKENKREFINVSSEGFPASDLPHFSSEELSHASPDVIGDPAVEAARLALGGKIVETRSLKK